MFFQFFQANQQSGSCTYNDSGLSANKSFSESSVSHGDSITMETVKGPDGVTSSGTAFYVTNENTSLLGSVSVERDRPVGKTSLMGAIFIVVNACIGAGMLNFPAAYQGAGGLHIGIFMQAVRLI